MDRLDNFRERFEVLEQQTKAMETHTRTIERRLRCWRGVAGGVVLLSLLSWALPSSKAGPGQGLAERVEALEDKLAAVTFDAATNVLTITGANLRIVNGLNATISTNGLGNLIVGYNELRGGSTNTRTGSHNVVVGLEHNFSSFGGLVVGVFNEISGAGSSVSGGSENTASEPGSSVSGGIRNTASGPGSSVSGGELNTASGVNSSVSGGANRSAPGTDNWAAGGLLQPN